MHQAYDPVVAAHVAHGTLPPQLRAELSLEDVLLILYLEFRFYEVAAGASEPSDKHAPDTFAANMELMVAFVSSESGKRGRAYTAEQIAHVLKGEDKYLRSLGLIAS